MKDRIVKIILTAMCVIAIATYVEITIHQTDSLDGVETEYWLPTTKMISDQLDRVSK